LIKSLLGFLVSRFIFFLNGFHAHTDSR